MESRASSASAIPLLTLGDLSLRLVDDCRDWPLFVSISIDASGFVAILAEGIVEREVGACNMDEDKERNCLVYGVVSAQSEHYWCKAVKQIKTRERTNMNIE
jgi:hypothetical protein